MIEDKTKELINEAIKVEIENATQNYGQTYHSLHEGYAILKEEYEEVLYPLGYFQDAFDDMWESIKKDDSTKCIRTETETMMQNLKSLIAEACQCCAVLYKIQRGI